MSSDLDRITAAYTHYARDPAERARRDSGNRGLMMLMGEWHDAVLEAVDHGPGLRARTRVLDVGCGDGWLLDRFAAAGVDVRHLHGIDLMPERVEAARRRVPGADIVVGSAATLPYPVAAFDAVCLGMVLSSIPSPALRRNVAQECRRVLDRDGIIVCYELRWASPRNSRVTGLSVRQVGKLFGCTPQSARALSLLPPVARRLHRTAGRAYPALARLRPLQARHLTVFRSDGVSC